ncbi:MAG TPA: serine/threonine-protein kinase, partial [Kofleriaceae bacterium]|nr:serine/threonine-protein kinase [Kofleriaceae bacterium]
MLGQTLGAYRIEKELGRGGMGAVYTAVHTLLGRRAAVKVLLSDLSRNQEQVQRFFNEARAATAIKHPSIVEIYDFGWAPDGSAYIVMELMEGEPLSARLRRHGRLPVPIALTIARQVANALHAAHRAGIIHRDLKPDNVFLVADVEVAGGERVKLLDFGIAKLAGEGQVSQTSTGAIMGTPLYMSPEQCEGARLVDPRSDLYSLGCMLFQMIAGQVPFTSEGVGGLIGMHLFMPAPALRTMAPDAPPEVEALVARLLAKRPDERFQSAEELAGALGRLGAASGAMMAAAPMPSYPGMAPPAGAAPSWPGAMPGVSTTLSSAAGAHPGTMPAPARSRRGLWLGLGGVAAAGAAVTIALVAGSGGG